MKAWTLLLAAAALLPAAGLPKNSVRGSYVEARTADVYTGPCFAMSEVNLTGNLAVMGWHVEQGSYDGVKLDGLSVMGVVLANSTLGDPMTSVYPVKAVMIVDEKASVEQQVALRRFAQRMAGDLLQNVVKMEVSPISFDVANNSIHSRAATMTAGSLAKVETRALNPGDQICHNEEVWYKPLVALDHAMAAYTETNSFSGTGLNNVWKYSGKRGSYVGSFNLAD
jgi:hypothetical protein